MTCAGPWPPDGPGHRGRGGCRCHLLLPGTGPGALPSHCLPSIRQEVRSGGGWGHADPHEEPGDLNRINSVVAKSKSIHELDTGQCKTFSTIDEFFDDLESD